MFFLMLRFQFGSACASARLIVRAGDNTHPGPLKGDSLESSYASSLALVNLFVVTVWLRLWPYLQRAAQVHQLSQMVSVVVG